VQDSLALVAIYDNMGGTSWFRKSNWKTNNPVSTWNGVGVSGGRVTELNLFLNNLAGNMPDEINDLDGLIELICWGNQIDSLPDLSNLTNLSAFYVSFNSLTSLPNLSNLTNLTDLRCDNNQLASLPDLSNLTNLGILICDGNHLTSLPDLSNATNLTFLSCDNNELSSLPNLSNLTNLLMLECAYNNLTSFPDLSNSVSFTTLLCIENHLSFEDIEPLYSHPNFNNFTTFDYAPQFGTLQIQAPSEAYIDDTLILSIQTNAQHNQYQWKKDGSPIGSITSDGTLVIPQVRYSDRGVYSCEVTNTLVTGFTLQTYEYNIDVYGIDSLGGQYIPNQLIVEFNPSTTAFERDQLRQWYNATKIDSCMCGEYLEVWELPEDSLQFDSLGHIHYFHNLEETRKHARGKPTVKEANFNYIMDLESIPYDKKIPIRPRRTQMVQQTQTNNQQGNVTVALLDTGIDTTNLALKGLIAPIDSPHCMAHSPYGINFVNSSPNTLDGHGHGTHIAGIIAGILDQPFGSNGLQILNLKTHDSTGFGNLFDATCAIYYALRDSVDIINISWGYQGMPSEILSNAISQAENDDVLVIASAGNESIDNDNISHYPSSYTHSNIISVTSIDVNDNLSNFSNYGTLSVDIGALGQGVQSTLPNGQVGDKNGTSMAAALVTKAAVISKLTYCDFSSSDIKQYILSSAEEIPALTGITTTDGKLADSLLVVIDVTPPQFGPLSPIPPILADSNLCKALGVTWTMPVVTDNSDSVWVVSSHLSGSAFPLGTTTVTFTATDAAGNTATTSFNITVVDGEFPNILNCPADITRQLAAGDTTASISVPSLVAYDNCGIASIINSFNHTSDATDIYPIGNTDVEWIVTDNSANTASCMTRIVVTVNCARDAFEPNDDSTATTTLPLIGLDAIICPAGDEDWYTFTVSATNPHIQIRLSNLVENYGLKVFNGSSLVAYADTLLANTKAIVLNNLPAGDYTIQVFGYGNAYNPTDAYTLQVQERNTPFPYRRGRLIRNGANNIHELALLEKAPQPYVFPNPAKEKVTMMLVSGKEAQTIIQITDTQGKVLLQHPTHLQKGINYPEIPIHSLVKGLYLIKVKLNHMTFVEKVVKQ